MCSVHTHYKIPHPGTVVYLGGVHGHGGWSLWRIARESSAVPCMCIYMLHASTAVLGRTAVLFYMYAIQVTACRTPITSVAVPCTPDNLWPRARLCCLLTTPYWPGTQHSQLPDRCSILSYALSVSPMPLPLHSS